MLVLFGEENDSEFNDVQETVAHSREDLDQTTEDEEIQCDVSTGAGVFHGGYGSASLRECLERV